MTATLIACSHGTHDRHGQAAISELVTQTQALLPDVRVEQAFVDVQEPEVDEVVDRWAREGPVVVVPLLLSTGFHTKVDIARAVAAHPGVAVSTPALGPHELLADVLESRLGELDIREGDAVVLAAAGSSDPAAAIDVQAMATLLEQRVNIPVGVGFASGAGTRIADSIDRARRDGATRVLTASYVLAPGHFARVIARSGNAEITRPLAPDPRIADIIAERYRAA